MYLEASFQDVVDDLHMWIDDLMTRTLFRAALGVAFLTPWGLQAQSDPTFPVNGTHDKALVSTVLEHATVHLDATTVLEDGTVVMHRGRIVAAGPAGEVTVTGPAVRLDMTGLHLYPSFVDVHSDFGTPEGQSAGWSRTQISPSSFMPRSLPVSGSTTRLSVEGIRMPIVPGLYIPLGVE